MSASGKGQFGTTLGSAGSKRKPPDDLKDIKIKDEDDDDVMIVSRPTTKKLMTNAKKPVAVTQKEDVSAKGSTASASKASEPPTETYEERRARIKKLIEDHREANGLTCPITLEPLPAFHDAVLAGDGNLFSRDGWKKLVATNKKNTTGVAGAPYLTGAARYITLGISTFWGRDTDIPETLKQSLKICCDICKEWCDEAVALMKKTTPTQLQKDPSVTQTGLCGHAACLQTYIDTQWVKHPEYNQLGHEPEAQYQVNDLSLLNVAVTVRLPSSKSASSSSSALNLPKRPPFPLFDEKAASKTHVYNKLIKIDADDGNRKPMVDTRYNLCVFARSHPKYYVIKNCWFERCTFENWECWCQVRFTSCRFTNCTFKGPFKSLSNIGPVVNCEFIECDAIVPSNEIETFKTKFRGIVASGNPPFDFAIKKVSVVDVERTTRDEPPSPSPRLNTARAVPARAVRKAADVRFESEEEDESELEEDDSDDEEEADDDDDDDT